MRFLGNPASFEGIGDSPPWFARIMRKGGRSAPGSPASFVAKFEHATMSWVAAPYGLFPWPCIPRKTCHAVDTAPRPKLAHAWIGCIVKVRRTFGSFFALLRAKKFCGSVSMTDHFFFSGTVRLVFFTITYLGSPASSNSYLINLDRLASLKVVGAECLPPALPGSPRIVEAV